jgi:hypothetical protein
MPKPERVSKQIAKIDYSYINDRYEDLPPKTRKRSVTALLRYLEQAERLAVEIEQSARLK